MSNPVFKKSTPENKLFEGTKSIDYEASLEKKRQSDAVKKTKNEFFRQLNLCIKRAEALKCNGVKISEISSELEALENAMMLFREYAVMEKAEDTREPKTVEYSYPVTVSKNKDAIIIHIPAILPRRNYYTLTNYSKVSIAEELNKIDLTDWDINGEYDLIIETFYKEHFNGKQLDPDNVESKLVIDALKGILINDDKGTYVRTHSIVDIGDKSETFVHIVPRNSFICYYSEIANNRKH